MEAGHDADGARSSPAWRDAICVALLLLVCLATRLPSLDRVALNPDESQYEATTAYLVASGMSAFSIPHTSAGTYTLYTIAARMFGPYAMFEVRVFVLLLVAGMALLVYALVRRETSPWSGLAGGLVLVLWSVHSEGLTANREWFSDACLLAGTFLFVRGREGRGPRAELAVLASGAACGAALWFKLHAAPLVLPIPLLCLWLTWQGDDRRGPLRALGLYTLGGVLATLVFLVPFALVGALDSYLASIVTDLFGYAGAAAPHGVPSAAEWSLFERFYGGLAGRPVVLAAYGFATLSVAGMVCRAVRRREPPIPLVGNPVAVLFVFHLVAAIFTVTIGARFFGHYYLFLVLPLAVLFGFAARLFTLPAGSSRWGPASAAGFVALLLIDRAFSWPVMAGNAGLVYLGFLVVLLLFGLSRPSRRWPVAAAGILAVELVFVGVTALPRITPDSAPFAGHRFRSIAEQLGERGRPGDRLFVWGWAPEIYSLTRMTPASHLTISQYVVDDTRSHPVEFGIDSRYERILMDELRADPPRFIVDAASRSWTMAASEDPWLYRLELYPAFALNAYMARHYRSIGRFDGTVLYERHE